MRPAGWTALIYVILVKMISYFREQDIKFVVYWHTVQTESS